MTSRILPPEEWAKLQGTEIGPVWDRLPAGARPVVVEHEGAIVGVHVLLPIWHVEGLWIAPAYRGRTSVARRLWMAVKAEAAALGLARVVTAAADERVCGLLAHVGAEALPPHFVVGI